jgi:hypothetical protein
MILVLTQKSRPERFEQFLIDNDPYLDLEQVVPFYSIDHPEPFKSFCLSQAAMIRCANYSSPSDGPVLLMEDDCMLKAPIPDIEVDFDLIYLGCNLHGEKPEPVTANLSRVRKAWMSHAIIYSKKTLEYIISKYNPHTWNMYDNWLSEQLDKLNGLVLNPMIAFQRPSLTYKEPKVSDLWGAHTDYTYTIESGNELMKIVD